MHTISQQLRQGGCANAVVPAGAVMPAQLCRRHCRTVLMKGPTLSGAKEKQLASVEAGAGLGQGRAGQGKVFRYMLKKNS